MIEFFNRLFKRETSGSTAKERLRLVLLSDHLSLAPDMVEALKRDLIEVISRYVEVDVAHCDVSFEQQDRAVAMLANIPIVAVPRNGRGPSGGGGAGVPQPRGAAAEPSGVAEVQAPVPAPEGLPAPLGAPSRAAAQAPSPSAEVGGTSEQSQAQGQTLSRKRRRRMRAAGPATGLAGALPHSPGQAS